MTDEQFKQIRKLLLIIWWTLCFIAGLLFTPARSHAQDTVGIQDLPLTLKYSSDSMFFTKLIPGPGVIITENPDSSITVSLDAQNMRIMGDTLHFEWLGHDSIRLSQRGWDTTYTLINPDIVYPKKKRRPSYWHIDYGAPAHAIIGNLPDTSRFEIIDCLNDTAKLRGWYSANGTPIGYLSRAAIDSAGSWKVAKPSARVDIAIFWYIIGLCIGFLIIATLKSWPR